MAIISWNNFSKLRMSELEDEKSSAIYKISNFQNKDSIDPIVLKKDFLKKVAENTENGTVVVEITLHYNILSMLYGFDTLIVMNDSQIDNRDSDDRKFSKNINLYKSLSSKEAKVLDYLKKIMEMPEEVKNSVKPLRGQGDDALTQALALVPDLDEVKESMSITSPLNSSHAPSQILVQNNSIYFYSNVVQKAGAPNSKLAINNDLKKITFQAFRSTREDRVLEKFRTSCFEAIHNRKDPAKIFEKANFLKSYRTQESFNDLDFIENKVLYSFINEVDMYPANSRLEREDDDDLYNFIAPTNNMELKIENHNYKKISFNYIVSPGQGNDGFNFSLYLAKSSEKKQEKSYKLYNRIEIFPLYQSIKESMDYKASGKTNLSRLSPIFIGDLNKEDSNERAEISLPLTYVESEGEEAYFCSRVISHDKNANSSFLAQKIGHRPLQRVQKVLTPGDSISRTILRNLNTGEVSFKSKIFPATKFKKYTPSLLLQSINSVKLFITTVHHSENSHGLKNQPINKIIVKNLPPNYEIHQFFRKYPFQSSKTELPVTLNNTVLNDVAPIPGELATYYIRFKDKASSEMISEAHEVTIKHRTLPIGMLNISLEQTGDPQNPAGQGRNYIIPVAVRMGIENGNLNGTTMLNVLKDGIDRVFQNSDGEDPSGFYDDVIREKIHSRLDSIGNFYRLYVREHDVHSEESSSYYLDPVEREENEVENSTLFTITVDAQDTRKIIFYNLILKNMHDLLDLDEIDEVSEESKRVIKRRTSAFFNSLSLANGVLPRELKINSKNSTYIHSSRLGNSEFQYASCLGGYAEVGTNATLQNQLVNNINLQQVHSTGEFKISWKYFNNRVGTVIPRAVDFFVICAIIEDYEVIIGSHPYIGFTDYHYRTQSFINVAGAVKFKIYPVYSDFRIDKDSNYMTEEMEVTDIKSFRADFQVD